MNRYRLGPFVLHRDPQPVLRNAANAVVKMSDSCRRILATLVAAAGETKTIHELLRAGWDVHVERGSVHSVRAESVIHVVEP